MMSPSFGEGPSLGPLVTTLYCRPDGRLTTPGALAFCSRKALAAWALAEGPAFSCGGGDGCGVWAWAAPAARGAASAAAGARGARRRMGTFRTWVGVRGRHPSGASPELRGEIWGPFSPCGRRWPPQADG